MRIIFLDIDGVLNCQSSKSRCSGFIGIDDKKVKALREIVEQTGAKIVLCSSWKTHWERTEKDAQNELANYLDRKMKRERLRVLDKTSDDGSDRGHGIRRYLSDKPHITSWCVIDDEIFEDYEECSIMNHLVKTSFYDDNGGLQCGHIEKAVEILMR